MTDCALNTKPNNNGSCLSEEHTQLLSEYIGDIENIINKCDNDECVLDSVNIPHEVKGKIKRETMKVPTQEISSTYWLNNTEIDNVMSQFRIKYPGFAHSFIHMCDLKSFNPSNINTFDYPVYSVHDIDFANEFRHALTIQKKINKPDDSFVSKISTYNDAPMTSFGIVCNTDSSNGSGQHWFCIYISTDHPDPDNTSKPWIRIELFNSAGGGCSSNIFNKFWNEQAIKISNATGLKCTFDVVTNIQHQRDDTGNCGSYSLFYIYSRLNNCLPREFDNPKQPITDYAMLKFRSVCFKIDNSDVFRIKNH